VRRSRDKYRSNENKFGRTGRGSWADKNNSKRNGSEIKVVSTNVTKEESKDTKSTPQFKQREQKPRPEAFKRFKREESRNNNTNNNSSYAARKERSSAFKENAPFHVNTFEKSKCTFCEKLIDDMSSAIFDKEKNQYFHFNCVMNKLGDENSIQVKERVVYLGSGAFGIIENQDNNSSKFLIKKKIQFIAAG